MSRILQVFPVLPLLLSTAMAYQPPQPPRAAVPRTRPIFFQPPVRKTPPPVPAVPAKATASAPVVQVTPQRSTDTGTEIKFATASVPAVNAPASATKECQCVHCQNQRRAEQARQAAVASATSVVSPQQNPSMLSRLTQVSHSHPQEIYISDDPGLYSCGSTSCCEKPFCDACDNDRWVTMEALLWWSNGSRLPAMATTSPNGTLQANAGVLGVPGTTTLFGGDDIFDSATPGFRIRGGQTIDEGSGIDFEFFRMGSQNEDFFRGSGGDPILARPFTNALSGQQDSELVGFPGISTGSLRVQAESRLWSAAVHLYRLAEEDTCCDDGDQFSAAIQIGPRFVSLKDSLYAEEFITGSQQGVQNLLRDTFKTDNTFFGGELGLQLQRRTNRTFVRGGLRLALGATQQELEINGRTTKTTGQGAATDFTGGLLAQRTNSGSTSRNRFSVIPQGEFTLGYETRWGWELTVGYNILYWTKVLRATEQIDTTLNPNLLPPEVVPFSGANRPAHVLKESGYLAHGISLGIEKRY